jgi:Tfp pilus assembly protein PilV
MQDQLQVRPRGERRGDESGFSIVEMLIVFSILAIAMLPLTAVQLGSRHQITEAERQSQAVQIAQAQIERAKASGFAAASGDTLVDPPFTAVTRVVPDAVSPFLQEIQVTVQWDYGDEPRTLTVASKQAAR